MENQVKKPWQSKTVILNALAGLGALLALFGVPGADTFVAEHGEKIGLVIAVANIVLRAVSKDRLSIKE
jgi:hypothetical protein